MYKKGVCALNLFRSSCCVLLLISSFNGDIFADNSAADNLRSEQDSDEAVVDAPAYNELLPIPGWNRYSGDTADSLGEWKRWWQYLLLEKAKTNGTKTVVMNWLRNLRLRIYPGNEVFRSIFVRGIYDPNMVVVLDALLPSKGVLIDIGANMGYCSLLMSRTVGEDGKVFAIEPSERDFLRLVDNVNLNKLNNVNVYRLAISDISGEVEISIASEERSSLNTLGTEFSNRGIEKIRTEKVEATTLDRFVEQEEIDKIDVIKMDIEGSEFKALLGAKDSIEMFRPTLILGINKNSLKANGSSTEDIEKILRDFRYKMYCLKEDPFFALKEITDLRELEGSWVVCLHESFVPPILPQPKKEKILEKVQNFFFN